MTQPAKPPIAAVSDRVKVLEQRQPTYRVATVVAVNKLAVTFDADVEGVGQVNGLTAPPHFLPAVDDEVLLRLDGSVPTYQPGRVAEGAIGEVELAAPVVEKINISLEAANGKNRVTYNEDPPDDLTSPGATVGDLWWQVTPPNPKMTVVGQWLWDGTTWTETAISDAVFTSITAALIVTGRLGAAVEIAVGDPTGVHSVIDGTRGLVIQAPDAGGVQRELNRYGRELAVIDPVTGRFLASMDSAGRVSGTEGNFTKLLVAGDDIGTLIADAGGQLPGWFRGTRGSDLGPIFDVIGVVQVGGALRKDRVYRLHWKMNFRGNVAGDEAIFRLIWSNGTDGDTTTQPPELPATNAFEIDRWHQFLQVANQSHTAEGSALFFPSVTSRFRVGLTMQRGAGSELGTLTHPNSLTELSITDAGPAPIVSGGFTTMGGQLAGGTATPPPPSVTQQYRPTLQPVGRRSWRGNGTEMTWVGNDVYQGYEATNGDTRGQFWFNLPPITGTVDYVSLFLRFRHWHFNSGGTARIGITDQRGVFTSHSFKPIFNKAGFTKPGEMRFLLPADWYPLFKGTDNNSFNGRATCITLGPGGGTNQTFYGVATHAELSLGYTQ